MKCKAPTPIFRIFDETIARQFYVDFLEFSIDWEHRFEPDLPLYMGVSKGDCLLHLSQHFGDVTPGSACRIEVDELERYHERLLDKKYKFARPGLQEQPWGSLEMCIHDPFGNRLVFFRSTEEPTDFVDFQPRFSDLKPMFRTDNLKGSIDFYSEVLGFSCTGKSDDDGWALLERDGVAIMLSGLSEHEGDTKSVFSGSLYITCRAVDHVWTTVKNRAKICYPIENFPYGMREFGIYDNNGYLIQIGTPTTP